MSFLTPPRIRRIRGGEIVNSPSQPIVNSPSQYSPSNTVRRLQLQEIFAENNNVTPTRTPGNRRNVISSSTQQTPFRNDGTRKVLYYIGYENDTEWKEIHINDMVLLRGYGTFLVTDINGTIITLHNLGMGKNYEIDMKQTRDGDGYRSQGYIVVFRKRSIEQLGPSPPLNF